MKAKIRRLPLVIFGIFSLFCLILLFSFRVSTAFAEWFSLYPARFVRLFLGAISSVFPFSLFEILIALFIFYLLFLLFLIFFCLTRRKKGKKAPRLFAFLMVVPIVLVSVLDLFVLSFASSYHRESTSSHMALATDQIEKEDLFFALESLVEIVNISAQDIEKNEKGESIPPDFDTVREKVNEAASLFGKRNSFYQNKGYLGKTFLSSPFLTYTHLSGVFGFFTGEANVNTNYPHFIVTASLAHESAHARGIAPENECNFLSMVILIESEDAYLRYCGASYLLDDFISACKKTDKEKTTSVLQNLDPTFYRDMAYYSAFFEPYRDSFSSKVANTANTNYLKAMGQKDGVLSYSSIVELTSAYFQKNKT
ncbi:MAG: DUF3810 family protein [Clostridia bacterium]|nr:DUF3810 family protein [Clostridia bacterium]